MKRACKALKAERQAAFECIVSAYESALLRYAGRLVRDSNAAQDIVQDAFIRLFGKWHEKLEPGPRLSSWLYRVVHNCAVDYVRKEARRHALHVRHAEQSPAFTKPDRGAGFRISAAAEKAVEALHALSLKEQQVVVLKVYEEKSYKEIAGITGLSTGNVGYILHHAMRKMAAELKKARAI
jgi:RNA polymerase sigma-70 factor (ECF subfamily)